MVINEKAVSWENVECEKNFYLWIVKQTECIGHYTICLSQTECMFYVL